MTSGRSSPVAQYRNSAGDDSSTNLVIAMFVMSVRTVLAPPPARPCPRPVWAIPQFHPIAAILRTTSALLPGRIWREIRMRSPFSHCHEITSSIGGNRSLTVAALRAHRSRDRKERLAQLFRDERLGLAYHASKVLQPLTRPGTPAAGASCGF
ncbi:hypothetical protein SBA6_180017 [Candidatus Sulfopaludibacter sp. SbA6]|nr:hypothetical protein SBA6_180017 [Candidatus Sulfopaludibacter sp. SbA6]